jgi:hypothetical protein
MARTSTPGGCARPRAWLRLAVDLLAPADRVDRCGRIRALHPCLAAAPWDQTSDRAVRDRVLNPAGPPSLAGRAVAVVLGLLASVAGALGPEFGAVARVRAAGLCGRPLQPTMKASWSAASGCAPVGSGGWAAGAGGRPSSNLEPHVRRAVAGQLGVRRSVASSPPPGVSASLSLPTACCSSEPAKWLSSRSSVPPWGTSNSSRSA